MENKILGKYKIDQVLGTGAYGKVVRVKTPQKELRAIKLISKEMLEEEQFLIDYLEDEIQSMLNLSSPFIVKLYDVEEDPKYKYLICEYCNGGDLLNLQSKQPNRVFPLEQATYIISEIVKGLEYIHDKNYLHRDIKSQNILLHQQNGKKYFKLADFGFAKRTDEIGGTVLGTEPYMAPEIFDQDEYGYEVDMWALGVLFFFMLNMEFPFKLSNPYMTNIEKRNQLKHQAEKFSYSAFVQKSKKKLKKNCIPEVEDIFKKFFEVETNKRLDFVSLREHPLFIKYFPIISADSRHLYSIRLKAKNANSSVQKPKNEYHKNSKKKTSNERFDEEEAFIQEKKQKIKILLGFEREISQTDLFQPYQSLSLRFCLKNYYMLLLKNLTEQKLRPNLLKLENRAINWERYFETEQFSALRESYKNEVVNLRAQISLLKKECFEYKDDIERICPEFENLLAMPAYDPKYDDLFRECYHLCTQHCYSIIRKMYKINNKNEYLNLLTIITIAHSYHILKQEPQSKLNIALKPFIRAKGTSYKDLKPWIWMTSDKNKKDIIRTIVKQYYT